MNVELAGRLPSSDREEISGNPSEKYSKKTSNVNVMSVYKSIIKKYNKNNFCHMIFYPSTVLVSLKAVHSCRVNSILSVKSTEMLRDEQEEVFFS